MRASLKWLLIVSALPVLPVVSHGQSFWDDTENSHASWMLGSLVVPPPKAEKSFDTHDLIRNSTPAKERIEVVLPSKQAYSIPRTWEEFDKEYSPLGVGRPHVEVLDNGLYRVNEVLFAMELFERHVNGLFNLEYSLSELTGTDSRSKDNKIDTFFDHAKVKTDFDWDAPVNVYVGLRFQIKCDSIFLFWK